MGEHSWWMRAARPPTTCSRSRGRPCRQLFPPGPARPGRLSGRSAVRTWGPGGVGGAVQPLAPPALLRALGCPGQSAPVNRTGGGGHPQVSGEAAARTRPRPQETAGSPGSGVGFAFGRASLPPPPSPSPREALMPEPEERPRGQRPGGVTAGGQGGRCAGGLRGGAGTLVTGKGGPMLPSVDGVSLTGIWNVVKPEVPRRRWGGTLGGTWAPEGSGRRCWVIDRQQPPWVWLTSPGIE